MSTWFTQNAPPTQAPPSAPPAAGSGGDWFAQQQQQPGQRPPLIGKPPDMATPATPSITDNPNGEGIYRMKGPDGKEAGIPYSNAKGSATAAGYKFADDHEYTRFMKDYLADPAEQQKTQQIAQDDPGLMLFLGAAKHALRSVFGLSDITSGTPEQREKSAKQNPLLPQPLGGSAQAERSSPLRQFADEPDVSGWQTAGGAGEDLGEFATGEGELKAANMGDRLLKLVPELQGSQKLAVVSKLLQFAEKHPLIGDALRQGLVAGAQTDVKTGGDIGAAAEAGAATAGTGLAVGGLLGAGSRAVASRATTLADVGGVETPVAAEIRNSAKPTPVQAAGQQSIKNAARDALTGHLEEVNESRATPAGPKQLPARTGPFEFNLKGVTPTESTTGTITPRAAEIPRSNTSVPANRTPATTEYSRVGVEPEYIRPGGGDAIAQREGRVWAERRIPGHMHSAAPGETPAETTLGGGGNLTTQDANIAKAHISNLNNVIESPDFEKMPPSQQRDLITARNEAQKQMADYHEQVMSNLPGATRPNLEPVDIPATLRRVGSWREAANELEKTGSHGYDLLNDVTGGKFNALRQENKDAWNAWTGASGESNQRVAKAALDQSEGKMAQMFKDLRGIVNEKELDGFNDAYRNAQGLHRVADAVESSFQGNMNPSRTSWEYRGFNGTQLMSNLTKLQQTMGRGALNRLIGEGNANTLFQVAELNGTLAQRGKFGAAVTAVAKNLPVGHLSAAGIGSVAGWRATHSWEGAAVGAAAGGALGIASSRVVNAMLTNPKIAKQLIYAMDYGKPENYGPFIASLIQKLATDSSLERQRQEAQPAN